MASYQNFIATISNTLVFALRSDDGRYVRLTSRTVTVKGLLQNRLVLNLNNTSGQPATLVLKAFSNTDNFSLFIETRNTLGQIQEFPITIVTDELTSAQFLQVDTQNSGTALRISPNAINQPGVFVLFASFTAVVGLSPQIIVDEFGFLRVGGGPSVPKFGFEALLVNSAVIWVTILPFILNGETVRTVLELIAGIVRGISVAYSPNSNLSMIDLLNSIARDDDWKARFLIRNATIALVVPL